jgi:hypothetical protein
MKLNTEFSDAVHQLHEEQYVKRIACTISDFATSEIGFRLGGTWAEHATSRFLQNELTALGLTDVTLEEIPTESCDFKGASLRYTDTNDKEQTFVASQLAGYKGTPTGGITAPIVYVGTGRLKNYVDVNANHDYFEGKIVLVDHTFDTVWHNWQVVEAMTHGCVGVVLTVGTPEEGGYMSLADDMLAGQDGQCPKDAIPTVFIAKRDGDQLKKILADAGEWSVTLHSNAKITTIEDGGTGYNVMARIEGYGESDKLIILSAHQDAHLKAGADNTGTVGVLMGLLKALSVSGYKPYYTIQALFTSSEEYGISGTVYDWQRGMFMAMQAHPDWAGRTVAAINMEVMPERGAPVGFFTNEEFAPAIDSLIKDISDSTPEMLPNGGFVIPIVRTIADDFTTTVSGIPSLCATCHREDYLVRYHSNYDRMENLDFELAGSVISVLYLLIQKMSEGLLPYDFAARSTLLRELLIGKKEEDSGLASAGTPCVNSETDVSIKDLMGERSDGEAPPSVCELSIEAAVHVGLDAETADRLRDSVESYHAAALTWNERRILLGEDHRKAKNEQLLGAMKKALRSFISVGPSENPIYPYQQSLIDATGLWTAISALSEDTPKGEAVLEGLRLVCCDPMGFFSLTTTACEFSKDTYRIMRELYRPKDTDWSGLCGMASMPDLYDIYIALSDEVDPDLISIKSELEHIYRDKIDELNTRMGKLDNDLRELASMINSI